MPSRGYSEDHHTVGNVAARDRAVADTLAAAEAMHQEDGPDSALSLSRSKPMPDLAAVNALENWVMDEGKGIWINTLTGEIADDLPGSEPAEEVFTLSREQIARGVYLDVSGKTGRIRKCPACGRRQLVLVRHEGKTYRICADALRDDPVCDYCQEQ